MRPEAVSAQRQQDGSALPPSATMPHDIEHFVAAIRRQASAAITLLDSARWIVVAEAIERQTSATASE
jgi:hypothetical protein